MPANSLRMSIDEILDEFATLPYPVSDEIQTVGSALLGSHVAWPNPLVLERSVETLSTKKKKADKILIKESSINKMSSLPPSLIALYYVMEKLFKSSRGLQLPIDTELFGVEISLWIVERDLIPFCNMEPITGSSIVAYVFHLYRNMNKDQAGKFLFVNPFTISHSSKLSIEDRARALSERLLLTTANQIVLAPCNVDSHWILTVIVPHKGHVYMFDSLYNRIRDVSWKAAVDNAMSIYNANKGKKFKNSAKWETIKFTNVQYSQVEIDEVREEWAKCVLTHVLD
ncbi:uncharacterized protein LOC131022744 isoform X3 [Salvia miltiorrhiza]|uniref:uncharacterized protein LOC131022744 isoform X3 n=1 Tax=Salvia miltiorrhiza TaxID=226208 RepID=UPI0025ACA0B6|nr:uncharacterized protein LOC131022744 isoform X3 [Salvia miltiorrhiza]